MCVLQKWVVLLKNPKTNCKELLCILIVYNVLVIPLSLAWLLSASTWSTQCSCCMVSRINWLSFTISMLEICSRLSLNKRAASRFVRNSFYLPFEFLFKWITWSMWGWGVVYMCVIFLLLTLSAAVLLTILSSLHISILVLREHRTQFLTDKDCQTSLWYETAQALLIRFLSAL